MTYTSIPLAKAINNPHRIKVKLWRELEGLEEESDFQEYLETLVLDSVCPAMCDEGCEVEPDGRCPHGCPSMLLALGLI